jgi:hypothetical protein
LYFVQAPAAAAPRLTIFYLRHAPAAQTPVFALRFNAPQKRWVDILIITVVLIASKETLTAANSASRKGVLLLVRVLGSNRMKHETGTRHKNVNTQRDVLGKVWSKKPCTHNV